MDKEDQQKADDVGVAELVAAHAAELETMYQDSVEVHGNARIMQKLPRTMRRRAASHQIKRLPRWAHSIAKHETVNNEPKTKKRPSRKHRRRPSNLMAEYTRRQRTNVWLETHIWHAKRFHMCQHWGYRLADFPNEKGWRACQRALKEYALMWDMSYMCCVEIEGTEDDIIQPLKRLMSEETGLTVGAKIYLDGSREGKTMMYQRDAYPYSAIGPVSFMWRPPHKKLSEDAPSPQQRRLWLWVHPSCYVTVLEELAVVFQAKRVLERVEEKEEKIEEGIIEEKKKDEKMDVDVKQVLSEKAGDNKDDKTEHNVIEEQKVKGKKRKLDNNKQSKTQHQPESNTKTKEKNETADSKEKPQERFNPEFCGPSVTFRSLKDRLCRYRLLGTKALRILQEAFKQPELKPDSEAGGDRKRYWWEDHEDFTRNDSAWREFKRCSLASEAPPNSVLGLTVRDPRLFLPKTITKTEVNPNVTEPLSSPWCSEWSDSPLWEKEARQKVKDTRQTEHQLGISRSQKNLPGSQLELGLDESRIPVLLVHQEASSMPPHLGSGYDVIVPAGWGMSFWIPLVYQGARVVGLKQLQQVDRELGRVHFPQDCPDTVSGQQWSNTQTAAKIEVYEKKPPAKRVNYQKLATAEHAFSLPWLDLLKSAANSESQTDGGEKIDEEDKTDERDKTDEAGEIYVIRSQRLLRQLQQQALQQKCSGDAILPPVKDAQNALVPVRVTTILKGVPSANAAICLPSKQDMDALKADRTYSGPSEPIHSVPNPNKKQKLNNGETSEKKQNITPSRSILGFVNEGDMSLSLGRGQGLGFISYTGLEQLYASQKDSERKIVLVRGINDSVYRFHSLQVIS